MSLIKVFYESDLRGGHESLAEVARSHKINVSKLEPGHFVAFVNKRKSGVKVYAASDVLAYMRKGHGEITEDIIRSIPLVFNGPIMGTKGLSLVKKPGGKKAA